MPLTGEGKNIGLNAIWHTTARWIGGLSAAAATAVEASAVGKSVKKTQTLKNGEVLYFSVLSGGAGLVALRPYYVVEESGTHFGLALTKGGTAVEWTTELKAASEYIVLTEIVYAESGKRQKTNFGAAAAGKLEDVEEHTLKIPAGKTINAEGYWEGETTGELLGISVLTTPESYGSNGTYVVKSSEADMNLAEGTPAP